MARWAKAQLLVTPGSEQIRATMERDGLLADLEAIGGTVLANACGPCIGQWDRDNPAPGEANTIVTSFNRNFPRRNDGSSATKAFVTSPETVIAYALAGTLDFNPLTDSITTDSGAVFRLSAPTGRPCRCAASTAASPASWHPPKTAGTSSSPCRPTPSAATPDALPGLGRPRLHRPAGPAQGQGGSAPPTNLGGWPWLDTVAHLENISGNLFLGVVNASHGGRRPGTRPAGRRYPLLRRHRQTPGSRESALVRRRGRELRRGLVALEHAAMEPRYRGGLLILARSFARIHETNLKKQGILPLPSPIRTRTT